MAAVLWSICLLMFAMMHTIIPSVGMRFHHSRYKVHHEMGKMKIKVKPEGAKLVFTGGDLEVEMHPAHGFVRPIHNVVVSRAYEHHEEEPETHHEIEHEEHEEEDEHSGHHMHEYHHSYHHDDHDNIGHHDDHHDHGHHDDEGYGFRHFSHWPMHEFFTNHHGEHHGHFRDEIGDSEPNQKEEDRSDLASRHDIAQLDLDQKDARDEPGESRDQTLAIRRLGERRSDSVLNGKKIYPEDVAAPTHKSEIENKLSEFSAKIAPGINANRDNDDGSTPDRTGGTLSPYDEENDKEKDIEYNSNAPDRVNSQKRPDWNTRNGYSREHDPKLDYKHLEKIANSIPPSIPEESEFHRETENGGNTKDIGNPLNLFVNMSGQPHPYGEENKEEPYPERNGETDPDARGDNPSDLYPQSDNEEGAHDEWDHDEEEEQDEMRDYIRKFNARRQRLSKLATEGAKKKNIRPPLVVHPFGDPREETLKKAFYDYNPTFSKPMHLASVSDFSVRNKIANSTSEHLNKPQSDRNSDRRRNLMINALIGSLKKT